MNKKQVAVNAKGNRIGETHHRARLTDEEVEMIHALHEDVTDPTTGKVLRKGLGYRRIAKKFDEMVKLPDGTEVDGYRPAWTTIRDVVKGNTRGQPIAKWNWIISGDAS